ncbi:MAG TPA: DUF4383 domain-containing protein [Acidimicrobiales bacterium]|jgi:hypothetical protein|nr:DUF4383 domain-containing protein [Acidimicrobiales bacterium]
MAYEFRGPGVQKQPQRRKERRRDSRAAAPAAPAPMPAATSSSSGGAVRTFAGLFGAAFLAIGILGFVPGVTSNYDQLELIGPDSSAELFGIFRISVVHNIVHLVFGVFGLLAALGGGAAVTYLVGGGLAYAGVYVYGILVERGSDLDILPVNDADNTLHLGLAVAMVVLGLLGGALLRRRRA